MLGLSVEGNNIVEAETILGLTSIYQDDKITYPVDEKIQTAIKNLWKRNQFKDVRIIVEHVTVDGIFLKIFVEEFPRLHKINITGYSKLKENEILTAVSKSKGDIIKPYDLDLIKKRIKKAYFEEGLQFTKIETKLEKLDSANVNLNININEGVKFYTTAVEFDGNVHYTNRQLEKVFDDTHTKKWYEFWRSAKFNPDKYEEDKDTLRKFYKRNGFMDFSIVNDTLIFDEEKGEVVVKVNLEEGEQYFVRNITFRGNTIYKDEHFLIRLDMKKGDIMNQEKFEYNLTGNQDQTDALALYMDNGYLRASMEPEYKRIGKDSVDIEVTVFENERFKNGKIDIVGNTKTKDKVIRRELFTRPGDYFDRSAVINSIRALGVLNYFNQESLKAPDVIPSNTDKNTVDLVYTVEERSNDQINMQVGFAGSYGLTLSLGIVLNNFCLEQPFQSGAGQTLNLSAEVGQGDRYRSFVLGFMEPWLFDKPTTVGFNIFHNRYNYTNWKYNKTGAAVNLGRRFKWPDHYFRGDWSFRSQFNNIHENTSIYYRPGKYWEHTISQTISRTNWNHNFFPSVGSSFILSSTWSMGALGIGSTDFLKNELRYNFVSPIWTYKGSDKLVIYIESRFGYITGLKSDTAMSAADLYYMGGDGMGMFGVIPLRGYDDNSVGQYWDANTRSWYSGNQVAAKMSAELRFSVSMDPMPIYVYGFAETGNLWRNITSTNLTVLKRSAGVGIQIMVPMLGNIGFSYGYGFDPVVAGGKPSGWKFLFHLGGI